MAFIAKMRFDDALKITCIETFEALTRNSRLFFKAAVFGHLDMRAALRGNESVRPLMPRHDRFRPGRAWKLTPARWVRLAAWHGACHAAQGEHGAPPHTPLPGDFRSHLGVSGGQGLEVLIFDLVITRSHSSIDRCRRHRHYLNILRSSYSRFFIRWRATP